MKYNPFRPSGIVPTHMFCGRETEMNMVRQSLFQTSFGNPQHFLFEGERGIGKSSLLHYIQEEASGRLITTDSIGKKFVVVSLELVESSTYSEILHAIATGFRSQMLGMKETSAVAKSAWEFLTSFKACGVEYKKAQNSHIEVDVLDELAIQMKNFSAKSSNRLDISKQYDGILVLIDEADKPLASARLGEFCKIFAERLSNIGCGNVCYGISGLPGLINKLRDSHESSPRLFETSDVKLLPKHSRRQVINRAIEDATIKNEVETRIDEGAANMIASLSEGYPHFLQQFGASAFFRDNNNHITKEDVIEGAFMDNGAIDQLGRRYFSNLYYQQIWSPDYRKVLHAMTEHHDSWVSRSEILKSSGVGASQLNNALHTLKDKGIVLLNQEKKGEYRLPNKAFSVWLKIQELKNRRKENDDNNDNNDYSASGDEDESS